jgi:dinuclear metal center YbgI/SA1388 family protein
MTVKDIASIIEEFAPLGYQESYDNAGLIVGSPASKVKGILLCVDVTPEVIDEAIANNANLIVAHHPVIFSGIKRLTGANYTERSIIKAIENKISIYCAHTNLDSVWNGVSMSIAKRLDLRNLEILDPADNQLVKLITFVPHKDAQNVRLAMFNAGGGQVGEYDQCSYNLEGTGTFRAGDNTNPHVGEVGEIHQEPETRVELIVPKPILPKVINALLKAHPYEEVAYDVYPLLNKNPRAGIGMAGLLPEPIDEIEFLKKIKKIFNASCIRHTPLRGKPIEKIAFCGGSGSSLLPKSIGVNADIFITSDVKYHQFFDADGKILIADIGHFESEQFTVDIFYELLTKKIANFAVLKTNVKTNPIKYL